MGSHTKLGSYLLRPSWVVFRCYAVVLLVLMLLENFLIFPAPRYPRGDWQPVLQVEDVYFESGDGTALHGWYVAPDVPPRGYVLYCHGNGEHVAHLVDRLQLLRDQLHLAVFAFDYRGYGRSEGSPNESGVLRDAVAAQGWLAQRAGLAPSELIYMGRSLGGAVAIILAGQSGARAVIVENTFPSLPEVAARLYWWAPVRWLMRSRFHAIQSIAAYRGPYLQSHGTRDELVPLALGRRLFDAAPGLQKRFLEFEGDGHNDPPPPRYWQELDRFLVEAGVPSR